MYVQVQAKNGPYETLSFPSNIEEVLVAHSPLKDFHVFYVTPFVQ